MKKQFILIILIFSLAVLKAGCQTSGTDGKPLKVTFANKETELKEHSPLGEIRKGMFYKKEKLN